MQVINAKDLIVEAQIAHHFGMPDMDALAAVTRVPARALRLDKRMGSMQEGYDADFVVSFTLSTVGIAPKISFRCGTNTRCKWQPSPTWSRSMAPLPLRTRKIR